MSVPLLQGCWAKSGGPAGTGPTQFCGLCSQRELCSTLHQAAAGSSPPGVAVTVPRLCRRDFPASRCLLSPAGVK